MIYDDIEDLDSAITDYINEGLKRDQICVIGSVYVRQEDFVERIKPLIKDFDENVKDGNLLILDLAPLYVSAMIGDTKPFDEAARKFEDKVRNKADKHVRFVGDGTGFLFKNRHFDECAMVEQWWEEKPFHGSYVCPYQKSLIEGNPHGAYAKHSVIATHDVVIDASGTPSKNGLYMHQQLALRDAGETGKNNSPTGGDQ